MDQPGDQNADRIEAAEEGDDDGGETVARRDDRLQLLISLITTIMPARPASASDRAKAKVVILRLEKPAKEPARGLRPSTLISKPISVLRMTTASSTRRSAIGADRLR